ncbi:sulfatase [Halobium palmae]|uniref:Sulfatase n=1 Tax=Halobium palmae TaxID=1776492 RepID=A0ABD5RVW4_9EURY
MTIGDSPNVLLIVSDQHRFDWLGTNAEVPVRTPNLDGLVDRGVRFTNAVTPSPTCGPARACLASGNEYDRCGVPSNFSSFPPSRSTYYERLRDDAGYHVVGCGKFDLHKPEYTWGPDGTFLLDEWGFSGGIDSAGKGDAVISWDKGLSDPYMAYLDREGLAETHVQDLLYERHSFHADEAYENTSPTPLPHEAYIDNYIGRNGIRLLDEAPEDRPWHLVVNFAGPHEPMDVSEEMHGWYRDPDVEFPGPTATDDDLDPETHQEIRRNYAAMIENVDRWVGRYLAELDDRGELEDTIVVFTSDHGEMLGDFGLWEKQHPYQASVGVPLIVAGPGVRTGDVLEEPTSLLDLHATFLDFAGVDAGDVDSVSLRPLLVDESEDHRDVAHAGYRSWRMAFDGRYKLVTGYDPADPEAAVRSYARPFASSPTDLSDCRHVLFDLDRNEREDVSDSHPEITESLFESIRRTAAL